VVEKNTGPLDQQSVTDIFAGIIRETRRLGTQRMQEQNGRSAITVQEQ
jgi:hypothetical protein